MSRSSTLVDCVDESIPATNTISAPARSVYSPKFLGLWVIYDDNSRNLASTDKRQASADPLDVSVDHVLQRLLATRAGRRVELPVGHQAVQINE